MQFKKVSRPTIVRPVLQAMLLTGCFAFGATAFQSPVVRAEGLTLFSGVPRGQQLDYHTDYGSRAEQTDRYYLKIKKDKMKLAVSKFVITYPDYFDGEFDTDKGQIEIKVNGKNVEVGEVNWDKDNYRLEIYPKKAVPAKTDTQLILSNVTNPDTGFYYLNCLIEAPGDVPIARKLGTWVLDITR